MAETAVRGNAPVDGGQLYFERSGQGPVIVLIHSAFLDGRMWEPQVAAYSRTHTVIRYDVRGHGASSHDRTGTSDGQDLTELLNYLQVPQAFLLGNSDGARIACEFAAGFPDRVPGLILVAGTPHDLDPTKEEEASFMDTYPDREGPLLELMRAMRKPEALELILDLWASQVLLEERGPLRTIASENYDRFVEFLLRTEPEGRKPAYPVAESLKKGRVPILSLSGAHDEPAVNMMMARFAAEVPSARHHELADGDHTPSLSARAEFDALVLEFLATIEGGQPWPPPRT
ncbi:MAG TPA: alpha/beta hydrolase [Thermoplasmata archaeon]|nr:alpha/beta hydrolase [Thermoplasmata archaeon]